KNGGDQHERSQGPVVHHVAESLLHRLQDACFRCARLGWVEVRQLPEGCDQEEKAERIQQKRPCSSERFHNHTGRLGAATPVSRAVLCHIEFAAGSCCGSTNERIIAGAEGIANASAMPKPVASRYMCHMARCLSQSRAPIAPTRIARQMAVIIINFRGDMRSATAPPMSMSTARGVPAHMLTIPIATAEPVNCKTTQGRATT